MVNMNHYKDPAIYGLTDQNGRVFYIGRTSVNAKNRWWQHRSRAREGHTAPVYVRIREIGIDNFGWTVIERFSDIPEGIEPRAREAWWIAQYLTRGENLVNSTGRDGRPDSLPPDVRQRMGEDKRGRPTWIKGKKGEEAGWTQERRRAQSDAMRARRWKREIADPPLLFARIEEIERKEQRAIQRKAAQEYRGLPHEPRVPRNQPTHGTRTMWEKYKCKCQPCRDAGARHNAKRRGKKDWQNVTAVTRDASQRRHGTATMYKHGGCRCDECRNAHRIQVQSRKSGQANPLQ